MRAIWQRPHWRGAVLLALLTALALAPRTLSAQPVPHIYLLRGFLDVFSIGLDGVAGELRQRGYDATVHNYAEWPLLTRSAAAAYAQGTERPIILIGHSAGGAAVVDMADHLGELGVPVALAVTLDPRGGEVVTGSVRHFVNLYFGSRSPVQAGTGFAGSIENINVAGIAGVDHMSVDDHPEIHRMIIAYILQALATGR